MSADIRLNVRPMRPDDIPYVMNSWLRTHRMGPSMRGMRDTSYYVLVRPVVEALLADDSLVRLVATPEDDDDMIAGFIVGDPDGPVVHFLKTRDSFRDLGVARTLLTHVGVHRDVPFAVTFDGPGLVEFRRRGWDPTLRPDLLGGVRL